MMTPLLIGKTGFFSPLINSVHSPLISNLTPLWRSVYLVALSSAASKYSDGAQDSVDQCPTTCVGRTFLMERTKHCSGKDSVRVGFTDTVPEYLVHILKH